MLVRVDSAIRIESRTIPDKLLERLRLALSFPNPVYVSRIRMKMSTAGISEELCFLRELEDEIRIPRGAIHLLRAFSSHDGVDIKVDDRRVLPSKIEAIPEVSLRDYQQRAVSAFANITQGMIVMPCGSGKSRTGIGAVSRLKTPTLILVHTLDLAEQWREEIEKLLGIKSGIIGGGENHPRPITIAVIQSLIRWEPLQLAAFLGRFGLLILDESHHVGAPTFSHIVDLCPARYRLGLTATPEREDGLTPLLELFLGRPVFNITHEQLIERGALTLPTIRAVDTAFEYPYRRAGDYMRMMSALAADKSRNALIIEMVCEEARRGNSCLVLSARVDHCHTLAAGIRAQGIAAEPLTGRMSKADRKILLNRARIGALKVLTATSLADEGLDLPRLSRVFLVYPSRAAGRTVQRLGRVMRPHPEKPDAALVDFVDRKIPILLRQYLKRRRLYADILGIPASVLRSQSSPSCNLAKASNQ